MGIPWGAHGIPKGYGCDAYGKLIGYPWKAHGVCMIWPRDMHELLMSVPGRPLSYPWDAHGIPMVYH